VLTVDDLPELAGSIPPLVPTPTIRSYAHAVLAGPVVRHAGEAVAGVVAEDRYRAADAAERVRVEYEVLPAATTPASALARGAPRGHPTGPTILPAGTASWSATPTEASPRPRRSSRATSSIPG